MLFLGYVNSMRRLFLVIFFLPLQSVDATRGPWPVARGPGATPSARPRANLGHAAVTRYISAWSGDAWRMRALVQSGAILPLPLAIFRRGSAQVRPVCAQAGAMRDNGGYTPTPDATITPKTRLKICTKSGT